VAKTTTYITVEPRWGRVNPSVNDGVPPLEGIKVVSITQSRPQGSRRTRTGSISFKAIIIVPDSVFMPLRPQVVIEVPEDAIITNPITVEVTMPDEPESED
jgi:hypothetical protein